MRIHGSNDFAPKADAADKKGRATSTVERTPGARATDDVSKGARSAEGKAAPAVETPSEAVVLSASASRMTEVSSEHSEAIRARLSEVKKMLDEGTYEVDFDALADQLLSEETTRSNS